MLNGTMLLQDREIFASSRLISCSSGSSCPDMGVHELEELMPFILSLSIGMQKQAGTGHHERQTGQAENA